jgi:hypothetical protein
MKLIAHDLESAMDESGELLGVPRRYPHYRGR